MQFHPGNSIFHPSDIVYMLMVSVALCPNQIFISQRAVRNSVANYDKALNAWVVDCFCF
jgi:hypothetical protein